jgi:hypothetical protein
MALGAYHRLAHHRITPQSNKPPVLAAVYIYSRRASLSTNAERLDWVVDISGHHITCISYLRRSPNTLTLLQASMCLRRSEMHE